MNFDSLPTCKHFKSGDAVYSRIHGMGKILRIYKDQPVVLFPSGKIRIDTNEESLALIPGRLFTPLPRPTLYVDGKRESRASLARKRKDEYVSLAKLADVVSIAVNMLESRLKEKGFQVHVFGKKRAVSRVDIDRIVTAMKTEDEN